MFREKAMPIQIECFVLTGDDVKERLSFTNKYLLEEKPISEYKENKQQVGFDFLRAKTSIHNLKKGITCEDVRGEIILKEFPGAENGTPEMAERVIPLITDDDLTTILLYAMLHQGGIMHVAESALSNDPLQIFGRAAAATQASKSVKITTHKDGHLTILSDAVFNDQGRIDDEGVEVENPTPLCVCSVSLDIRLVDNPDAKDDDPPEKKKMASITPSSMTVYVVPGREALFNRFYGDFIKPFKKETRELQNIEQNKEIESEKLKLLKKEPGLSSAVYQRGMSFIAAANLIAENADQDEKSQLLKEELASLENFWTLFCASNTVLTKDHLAQLENILIETIRNTIYRGEMSFSKVKIELDNAENHVNWMPRKDKSTEAKALFNGLPTNRKERPISQFTDEQTAEWLSILSNPPPLWFKHLPKWEQNYFKKRVREWNVDVIKKSSLNLGEFLGPVPTTIRRYPGAPNAYVTSVSVTQRGSEPPIEFTKIRSGVLVPPKLKGKTKEEQDEKVRIARQNLEQLVIVAILEKKKQVEGKEDKGRTLLPILLQTLYSPPFQPPGAYSNRAMMRAFKEVRDELRYPKEFNEFLKKHGIDPTTLPFSNVELLYSNRPVNNARGLSAVANLSGDQGRESRHTDSRLRELARQKLHKEKDPILKAALESYERMPYVWNTVFGGKPTSSNPMAEKAALEQIIAGRLGMRIGSCVSGKDREEMVTQIAIAQLEHYAAAGHFPPPYNATGAEFLERAQFNTRVAQAYLTGHGQALAGENSKGCDGLKNIRDVLGKDICDEIKSINRGKGNTDDPISVSQRVAGLNKLENSYIKYFTGSKNVIKGMWENYKEQVLQKAQKPQEEEQEQEQEQEQELELEPEKEREPEKELEKKKEREKEVVFSAKGNPNPSESQEFLRQSGNEQKDFLNYLQELSGEKKVACGLDSFQLLGEGKVQLEIRGQRAKPHHVYIEQSSQGTVFKMKKINNPEERDKVIQNLCKLAVEKAKLDPDFKFFDLSNTKEEEKEKIYNFLKTEMERPKNEGIFKSIDDYFLGYKPLERPSPLSPSPLSKKETPAS